MQNELKNVVEKIKKKIFFNDIIVENNVLVSFYSSLHNASLQNKNANSCFQVHTKDHKSNLTFEIADGFISCSDNDNSVNYASVAVLRVSHQILRCFKNIKFDDVSAFISNLYYL